MPYFVLFALLPVHGRLRLTGWLMLIGAVSAYAQPDTTRSRPDTVQVRPQADLLDAVHYVFPRLPVKKRDTAAFEPGRRFFLVLPESGYSLQTSLVAQATGNLSFRQRAANVSTVITTLTYTLNRQAVLMITTNVWSTDNRFNLVGDWRIEHFPQATFGLGIHTDRRNEIQLDFAHIRFYQSLLTRIRPNTYAGAGYAYDRYFGISSRIDGDQLADISGYPYGVRGNSVASGPRLTLLYDNRANAINPTRALYANVEARAALTALGSSEAYQSVLIDVRKYIALPGAAQNILALWSYNSLTINGNPPYLNLPSTGNDKYGNSGRGFIQGRYRGPRFLYSEAEYRFGITRNRLLGGVLFANAQTVTGPFSNHLDRVVPGGGGGLRFQMNKISRLNLCLDYGFGADGSRGIFFNLGEVF